MITLFIIGTVIFVLKMAAFAIKAAWGIAKAILFVAGIPVILIGLLIKGIVTLAVPLLVIALLAAFLLPAIKQLKGNS